MKRFIRCFFSSKFLPTALLALPILYIFLLGFSIPSISGFWVSSIKFAFGLFLLAFVLYFLHLVYALFKKRWILFVLESLLFSFLAFCLFIFLSFLYSFSLMGEPDTFADDLIIPADIDLNIPETQKAPFLSKAEFLDGGIFQSALIAALNEDAPEHKLDIPAIKNISNSKLLRYLSASSDWKLYLDKGDLVAERRWYFKDEPCVAQFYHYPHQGASAKHFSFYCRIYFDEKISKSYSKKVKSIRYSLNEDTEEFDTKINLDYAVLHLSEVNKEGSPKMSYRAIELINDEFEKLAHSEDFNAIKKILPPTSIRNSEPSFGISNYFQTGIYILSAWLNPMEEGYIYLKAFELTKGTPLSVTRLRNRSNEFVGYSDNADEVFFSMTEFTIYEGAWGKPYAARFELYFVPSSGKPERKLLEKIYKIEGWDH